jgi:hypothetical protein
MRTWKVLKWINEPKNKAAIPLDCPHCGTEAELQFRSDFGALIIAANGLRLILDPPGFIPPQDFMPDVIQCRHCFRIFSEEKTPCTESSSPAHSQAQ